MKPKPLKPGSELLTQIGTGGTTGNGMRKFWAMLGRACHRPSGAGSIWPGIVVAWLISWVCLTVPVAAPDLGVDTSWCAVLQWAHEQGRQFGKDLVFTYGPLGYLLAPYCLAPPSNWLILCNAALCFHISLGLCLLAWRLAPAWRMLLLVFFVITSANAQLRADLLLDVGFLCWGLLCILDSSRRQGLYAAGFVLVAGFAALTKVVYLFVGGFSITALTMFLLLQRQGPVRWLLVPGFGVALLAAWVGCGQGVAHLGPFLLHAFVVSRDYDQAVALEGLPRLRSSGILLGVAAAVAVLLQIGGAFDSSVPRARLRRAVLLGWVGALLLLAWKHSLVRLDRLHFFHLAVFAPVAAIALEALPGPTSLARTLGRISSLACACLSLYVIESTFLPGWVPAFAQVFSQFANHAQWLISPGECRRGMERVLEERRREAQLPKLTSIVGNQTVDVFGFHQGHALLNGLNYKPRPVFQSYLAYNRQLARLNEEYYLSKRAPDYVLFELMGIEHRFPALDDGSALGALLINYAPVAGENGFLLLKRESSAATRLRFLQQGSLRSGERLELRRYSQKNLWLEMEVKQSWWRRIGNVIYRPSVLRLSVWPDSPVQSQAAARRRAAGSVLAAGFLASPFLLETAAVGNFYSNQVVLRPQAISVDLGPGDEHSAIGFRVYSIENLAGDVPGQ